MENDASTMKYMKDMYTWSMLHCYVRLEGIRVFFRKIGPLTFSKSWTQWNNCYVNLRQHGQNRLDDTWTSLKSCMLHISVFKIKQNQTTWYNLPIFHMYIIYIIHKYRVSKYHKTMLDSREFTWKILHLQKKTTTKQNNSTAHLEKNSPDNLQLASLAAWRNTRAHRDTASCRSDPLALAVTDEVPGMKTRKLPEPQNKWKDL